LYFLPESLYLAFFAACNVANFKNTFPTAGPAIDVDLSGLGISTFNTVPN